MKNLNNKKKGCFVFRILKIYFFLDIVFFLLFLFKQKNQQFELIISKEKLIVKKIFRF